MSKSSRSVRKEKHHDYMGTITYVALLGDAIALSASLCLAYYIRFQTIIADSIFVMKVKSYTFEEYTPVIIFGFCTGIVLFLAQGLYDKNNCLRFKLIVIKIARLVFYWFCGFLGLALVFKLEPDISRFYVMLSSGLLLVTLISWRFILLKTIRSSSMIERIRQRMLIVGWVDDSSILVDEFSKDPMHPYKIVACMPISEAGYKTSPPLDINVIKENKTIKEIIDSYQIEVVLLSEINTEWNKIVELSNLCERMHVDFKVMPSYYRVLLSGLNLESIGNIPILGISKLPLDNPIKRFLKNTIDVVGGTVGLLMSLPVIVIFSILVYIESPSSSPLFRQKRMGRKGKVFNMYKIRSMKPGSQSQNTYTIANDSRRLRIGTFLRHWNIDELPQFWNVIKGDMSLVGPRPEVAERSRELESAIPYYNARYNIKPGMTGLSQVRGLRGDTDLSLRVIADLEYLENWSIWLDFHILARTLLAFTNAS